MGDKCTGLNGGEVNVELTNRVSEEMDETE
jgi:hypothetical protein